MQVIETIIAKSNDYDSDNLSELISIGLSDNWSQVRFAASSAARNLLLKKRYNESLLIPKICFNRHHMADGVKNYNQETWRIIFAGDQGKQILCKYASEVCNFYET